MISISLCMIVRDEEDVLGRCLESIKNFVDEIIIIDTGSVDQTKELALSYTDKVYDFTWQDDFSVARNFGLKKAKKDYLMWMDADDVLPQKEAENFLELKRNLPADTDVVMMPYATAFDAEGKSTFTYYRERIVRNFKGYFFRGRVHEVIPPSGKIFYSDIPIWHKKIKQGDPERNLKIYRDMEARGETFDSRSLYYYGRELVFRRKYIKASEILEKFMDMPEGWKENKIDAARRLSVCYYAMNVPQKALKILLQTFEYDVPRGEVCCDLGRHFMDRNRYAQAIYWYKRALTAKKALKSGAFVEEECYGFLPAISLCICYDRIGSPDLAEKYNELAGKYNPHSPYYMYNLEYFRNKRQKRNVNI